MGMKSSMEEYWRSYKDQYPQKNLEDGKKATRNYMKGYIEKMIDPDKEDVNSLNNDVEKFLQELEKEWNTW